MYEIQLSAFRSGATLTYGAYETDGTVRTAAGTALPEVNATGYYKTDDVNVVAGDIIVIKEGVNVVAGGFYGLPLSEQAVIEASQSSVLPHPLPHGIFGF